MTHKTRIILIIGVVFMAAAAASFAFVSYEVSRIGTILEERVATIANRYAQEQKYTELNDLVQATEVDRDALGQYLLSESDTISFLTEIERIGVEQGVELATNNLMVTETPKGTQELAVSFSVSGADPLVLNMLEIIELLPYEHQVTKLSLQRGTKETNLRVDLLLTLF